MVTRIRDDGRPRDAVEYLPARSCGRRASTPRGGAGGLCDRERRLALLSASSAHRSSAIRSGRVGRRSASTPAFASALMHERLHPHRGRSASHVMMEPLRRDGDAGWPGARASRTCAAAWSRSAGSPQLIDEALAYDPGAVLRRSRHKDLMRGSSLRDRMLGCQMLAEDLPQLANRRGSRPLGCATSTGCRSRASPTAAPPRPARFALLGAKLREICVAAGAERARSIPAALGWRPTRPRNHTRTCRGRCAWARTRPPPSPTLRPPARRRETSSSATARCSRPRAR